MRLFLIPPFFFVLCIFFCKVKWEVYCFLFFSIKIVFVFCETNLLEIVFLYKCKCNYLDMTTIKYSHEIKSRTTSTSIFRSDMYNKTITLEKCLCGEQRHTLLYQCDNCLSRLSLQTRIGQEIYTLKSIPPETIVGCDEQWHGDTSLDFSQFDHKLFVGVKQIDAEYLKNQYDLRNEVTPFMHTTGTTRRRIYWDALGNEGINWPAAIKSSKNLDECNVLFKEVQVNASGKQDFVVVSCKAIEKNEELIVFKNVDLCKWSIESCETQKKNDELVQEIQRLKKEKEDLKKLQERNLKRSIEQVKEIASNFLVKFIDADEVANCTASCTKPSIIQKKIDEWQSTEQQPKKARMEQDMNLIKEQQNTFNSLMQNPEYTKSKSWFEIVLGEINKKKKQIDIEAIKLEDKYQALQREKKEATNYIKDYMLAEITAISNTPVIMRNLFLNEDVGCVKQDDEIKEPFVCCTVCQNQVTRETVMFRIPVPEGYFNMCSECTQTQIKTDKKHALIQIGKGEKEKLYIRSVKDGFFIAFNPIFKEEEDVFFGQNNNQGRITLSDETRHTYLIEEEDFLDEEWVAFKDIQLKKVYASGPKKFIIPPPLLEESKCFATQLVATGYMLLTQEREQASIEEARRLREQEDSSIIIVEIENL